MVDSRELEGRVESAPAGVAILEAGERSVARALAPSFSLRLDDGSDVRVEMDADVEVEAAEQRRRGAWPSLAEPRLRELFTDVAPGPGVECQLTVRSLEGCDVVVEGEPSAFEAPAAAARRSAPASVRSLRARRIRVAPATVAPAARRHLPKVRLEAAGAALASLVPLASAAWPLWGDGAAAWAARLAWLTLSACGLWNAARLAFGVPHAHPLAPEPMWVPQLARSEGERASGSAGIDGTFGAVVALLGNAFFLWDAVSLALTEGAVIGRFPLVGASLVTLGAAGLVVQGPWRRAEPMARSTRALLGGQGEGWSTVEGVLSDVDLSRDVAVRWVIRGMSHRTRVPVADMDLVGRTGGAALEGPEGVVKVRGAGLRWSAPHPRVVRTPNGLRLRVTAARGARAVLGGYIEGDVARARGEGSLLLFVGADENPRGELRRRLALHYLGPGFALLGALVTSAALVVASLL